MSSSGTGLPRRCKTRWLSCFWKRAMTCIATQAGYGTLPPAKRKRGPRKCFCGCTPLSKRAKISKTPGLGFFVWRTTVGLKIRAQQSSQTPFDADLESQLAGPAANPEQSLIERQEASRFHNAIRNLSEQQRRCLFLRLEGLRYPEIASVLGISASAVGEFLRRAIARLKKGEL